MHTPGVPFDERGGALRGALDLFSGRFPRFIFGGGLDADTLPVFHFHDVTRDDLEPKLRYLADNGYRTVTSDEIAGHARRTTRLPERSVALCFDDAWASLSTVAAPLLTRHGLRAITYAIPARITDAPGPFVSWSELRALHTSGVIDVQCHTDTHSMMFCSDAVCGFVTPDYASGPLLNRPQLVSRPALRFITPEDLGAPLYPARSRMSDGRRAAVSLDVHQRCVDRVAREGGAAFFARSGWQAELTRMIVNRSPAAIESDIEQTRAIEEELDRGRSVLNERLCTTTVNHICLPWGVSGRITSAALARLGYQSAFANRLCGVHAVRPGDDVYWLKRLPNRYIFRLPGRGRRWAFQ